MSLVSPVDTADLHLIELRNVSRTYDSTSGVRVNALEDVSLRIRAGEFIGIVGQSGSGKTTLMNIIGCLDRPSEGQYVFMGIDIGTLGADELSSLRSETFGFVFQNYNLIATATACENIELPGVYSGIPKSQRRGRAMNLVTGLGILDCADRTPSQLSGGQQQRTAIARALMNDARIILADEPTGSLDSRTGQEVGGELQRLADQGRTVILVTHDPRVAEMATRRIELLDGRIISDDERSLAEPANSRHSSSWQSIARGRPRKSAGIGGTELLKTAAHSLRTNLLRSCLTLLGVLIGVAAVVALMFIGESSRRQVMDSIHGAGADQIRVRPNPSAKAGAAILTPDDVHAIRKGVLGVEAVLPEINTNLRVRRGGQDMPTRVTATGSLLPNVLDWRLASGAFFLERDSDTYEPLAVIGHKVQSELFGKGEDPLGKYIWVGSELFTVIGVMEEKGGLWANELDRSVFVPLRTGSARLVGRWTFDLLTVQATEPAQLETTAASVKSLLEHWHGDDSVRVTADAALIEASAQVYENFRLLLASIAAISLVVGGIGIMNMLLTSVTERTREIGIRMAVGARRLDILRQFLTEAIMISTAGAIAGLVVGAIIGNLVIQYSGGNPVFTALPIALALGSALLIGLVFGYAPARRAAHMEPVRALAWE